ncbi:tRNA uridine-5-carboxymethylaminomethyl(34) synthesis GTPase MnmE [Legionella jordanis]|uniref:tRNA modification GTPase MnmE n=1 Tax=Legionella jordanis TaxID=456 RepID=A0A0W0VDF2_9GAMM|nr:tRNA uridine-5-carboxymethylaminomethyl(34) synthesis GTPase MnmE [Legionella jordanis]KTD17878.1 GTPase [Legionella jordanis]RMX02422.1 tRNA uridine-5-carboxymethylaminomethyl(34) synthesis GTPase MnmE [Legionella jordanis]RMX21735.1 tRNA uridine-5-carboxymethylaminomethyl(34) synthesis GTPase MnmE [Legionella jordanis]VEH14031.1 GTPase [Legionella jordanis]HAT8713849.1 tRNA uridine-5-carboxymethylaminomethyl(34) synthesis GTPase MnmE [Legionella jordanis]
MSSETIAAIATPPGRGGVGIVRLSGPLAYNIALQLNAHKNLTPRVATFCTFQNQQNEVIDHGLALFFKAPHSFTGEDVVEFQVHGSPMVLDNLLAECLLLGARLARPGEFSERAFLNDKMDLTQAEAIADLIQASSQTAARLAIRSLQGDFSKKIHALNEEIINLRLFVEAAIDFPEEEIDFLSDGKVASQLAAILEQLLAIRSSASQGAILREGLTIVLAGRPNAGKSTLINALAGRDVAIVTDVAGTTRDVMRENILLDDIPLHVVDTAGLRESDDVVEREGIKRAWHEVSRADCVIMVMDLNDAKASFDLNEEIRKALPEGVAIIPVYNKIDSLNQPAKMEGQAVYLSAKSGEGLKLLKERIKQVVGYQPNEGQFLARRRHLQALDTAKDLLLAGQRQLQEQRAGELLAEDLRLAHQALCEITGEFSSDDLLGRIFSSFCIGK